MQTNAKKALNILRKDSIADELQAVIIDSLMEKVTSIPVSLANGIYNLAQECPFEKGMCVLWARAAFPDSVFFNLCESEPDSSGARLAFFDDEDKLSKDDFLTEYEIEFKIYPNPAPQQSFNVEIKNFSSLLSLEMFDILGRKRFESILDKEKNTIAAKSLPEGMFLYRITDNAGKIWKQGRIILKE